MTFNYTPSHRHPETDRAKSIITEIIRCAGGRIDCKTRLFKIFYIAHLMYAKNAPDYLSEWPIVRMPYGPGIGDADDLFREMVTEGTLETVETSVGPFKATEFRTTTDVVATLPLPAIDAIREAVEFAKSKTAAELSELTHQFSNSWKSSANGDELDIYVDLLKEEVFLEMQGNAKRDIAALDVIFG